MPQWCDVSDDVILNAAWARVELRAVSPMSADSESGGYWGEASIFDDCEYRGESWTVDDIDVPGYCGEAWMLDDTEIPGYCEEAWMLDDTDGRG